MATISQEPSIPALAGIQGILTPAMAHRFRVTFADGSNEYQMLALQVVSCKRDIINQTCMFEFEIPLQGRNFHNELHHFVQSVNPSIIIEHTDGGDNVMHSIAYTNLKFTVCEIEHSYATSGTLKAHLSLEFGAMESTSSEDGVEQKCPTFHPRTILHR
jgi:hypothetical protein